MGKVFLSAECDRRRPNPMMTVPKKTNNAQCNTSATETRSQNVSDKNFTRHIKCKRCTMPASEPLSAELPIWHPLQATTLMAPFLTSANTLTLFHDVNLIVFSQAKETSVRRRNGNDMEKATCKYCSERTISRNQSNPLESVGNKFRGSNDLQYISCLSSPE